MSIKTTTQAPSLENDYIPCRFGLSYNPPQIVVEYKKSSSGKLYHHKIKFRDLSSQSKIPELIDEMYKKHTWYLSHKSINKEQIIQLVKKLREKYLKLSSEEEMKKQAQENIENEYNFSQEEDLNKLSKEELDLKKKQMDKFYDRNNIKKGDKNFQYDVRKDFDNEGQGEWDESFEY